MRSFILIGLIGVLLASTSIAQAHNTRWAWTESKAAKMVARDATVKLCRRRTGIADRRAQRRRAVVRRPCLRRAAGGRRERRRRRSSLSWPGTSARATRCGTVSGSPPPPARARERRCRATASSTSAAPLRPLALEIPQTELDYGDQELPTVIEGSPRIIGPLEASLDVHVAGKASIAYRKVAR